MKMLLITAILLLVIVVFLKYSGMWNTDPEALNSLTVAQVRYKLSVGHSICIRDKVKDFYMLVYPIDFRSARILIPKIHINRFHLCEVSLLCEVMELIDSSNVEVYDGEDFIASSKN